VCVIQAENSNSFPETSLVKLVKTIKFHLLFGLIENVNDLLQV